MSNEDDSTSSLSQNIKMDELYRVFVEQSPLSIMIVKDGQVIHGNRESVSMLGFSSPEEIVGLDLLSFIHPDQHDFIRERLMNIAAGKPNSLARITILKKNSTYIQVETTFVPYVFDGDNVVLIYGRDVTEQVETEKVLKDRENSLSSILRVAPVGFGLVINRVIQRVNEKMCEITGYESMELLNQDARMLYPSQEEYDRVGKIKYRMIKENGTGTVETQWQHKNGTIVEVLLSSTPLDRDNLSKGVTFTALDVTEQKKAMEQLEFERFKFQEYFENLPLPAYIISFEGTIEDCNNTALSFLGYSQKAELIGKPLIPTVYAPEAQNKAMKLIEKWKKERKIYNEELQVVTKNGETRDILLNVDTIFNHNNEPMHSLSTHLDVTDRMRAEENLRESQSFNETLLNMSPDIIYIYDLIEKRNIYINKGIMKVLGYTVREIKEMKEEFTPTLMHPDDFKTYLTDTLPMYNSAKDGEFIEHNYRMLHKDGEWRFLQVKESIFKRLDDGSPHQIFGIIMDITKRRSMEEELRQSEEKFRSVFEDSSVAMAMTDEAGKYFAVNKSMCEIFGYSQEEFLSMKVSDISVPNEINERSEIVKDLWDGKRSGFTFDKKYKHKDGTEIWGTTTVSPVKDVNGKTLFMVGQMQDITKRKQMEVALAESEEKYRLLFQSESDAIVLIDSETKLILDANRSALDMYGYKLDEILKLKITDISAEPVKTSESIDQALINGISYIPIRYHWKKNGKRFPVEVGVGHFEMGNRKIICGIMRDISERMKIQEELELSENKYRTLVEQSLEGIIIVTGSPVKIVFANTAFAEITGFTINEILGMEEEKIYELIHPDDREIFFGRFTTRLTGRETPSRYELRGITKDKRDLWLAISFTLVDYQGMPAVQAMFTDISERKLAEETLRETLQTAADIVNTIPSGMFIYQFREPDELYLLTANPEAERLTGINPADWIDQEFNEIWPNASAIGVKESFLNVIRTGVTFETEEANYEDQRMRGAFRVHAFRLPRQRLAVAFEDITPLKRVELALRESEGKLRTIVEHSSEVYFIHGVDHKLTYVTPQSTEVFGYTPEEMKVVWTDLTTENPINEIGFDLTEKAIQTGKRQGQYNLEVQKKDGSKIICRVDESPVLDEQGKVVGIAGACRDVTKQRIAEEKIENSREQLRELTTYLQTVRENERTVLAREIHDEFGQSLTALKMDLSWLSIKLKDQDEAIIRKCKVMNELIDDVVSVVHRISSNLRPGLLDDLGLAAAIEWQAAEVESRTGIVCSTQIEFDGSSLPEEVTTALFRIFQESLTNVVRHASAKTVASKLSIDGDTVVLRITDDGIGIPIDRLKDSSSYGLIGMRERALSVGGDLIIDSTDPVGTTITVSVPF